MTEGRSRSLKDLGTAMAEQVIDEGRQAEFKEVVETVKTIDVTPSPEGYVDSLLMIFTSSSSSKDRTWARSELHRMARISMGKPNKEECDHAVNGPCPHYS